MDQAFRIILQNKLCSSSAHAKIQNTKIPQKQPGYGEYSKFLVSDGLDHEWNGDDSEYHRNNISNDIDQDILRNKFFTDLLKIHGVKESVLSFQGSLGKQLFILVTTTLRCRYF